MKILHQRLQMVVEIMCLCLWHMSVCVPYVCSMLEEAFCTQEGTEGDRGVMAVKKRMGSWQAVTGSTSTKHGIGSEA